ncbi:glycosyltransferase family 39 protein [Leptospira sp. 96542]|nr:glycosyltransferase family 39 protein [Leptospira sp. 96542]
MILKLKQLFQQYRFELFFYLLFLVGTSLRFYKFDRQSLWGDELYSVFASTLPWQDMFNFLHDDPHPPLFQVFLKLWMYVLPVQSELSVRLFPIIVSVLNLILVWYLTIKWEKTKRILFLFLFIFSPGAIYYAQEVRSYSPLLFFSSVIFILFSSLENSKNNKLKIYILVFLSIAISYTHLFGFVFCGSLYLVFWIKSLIDQNGKSKEIFLLGLFTFLGFIPFILQLMNGTKIATAGWIEPPGEILAQTYYNLFFYFSKKTFYLTLIIPFFYFLYSVFVTIREKRKTKDQSFYRNENIYLFVSLVILFSTTLFSFYKPIVTNRNWIITLPLFYYFFACFLAKQNRKVVVYTVLVLLTFFSLVELRKTFYTNFKEDWRGAVSFASVHCAQPLLLTDAYPEYVRLYLRWAQNETMNPILTGEKINMSQNSICVLKRFLGGNGEPFFPEGKYIKLDEKHFYGFVIEEYTKVNLK